MRETNPICTSETASRDTGDEKKNTAVEGKERSMRGEENNQRGDAIWINSGSVVCMVGRDVKTQMEAGGEK